MKDQLFDSTKQLKRQFIRSFNSDGLLDIFVGWSLVATGLWLLTSATFWSFAGWMPFILIAPLKQRFIIPRFGYVKFSQPTPIPLPVLIGAGALIVVGSLLSSLLGNVTGSIAIGLLGIALIVALATGLNRIAAYAVFVPLFFIVGLGLKILTPAIVILTGAVLMTLGVYLFVRFIKKHPLPGDDQAEKI
jgi:hypothetical protein